MHLTLIDLTLANGHVSSEGGAIVNNIGTFTVTNSTFSGNTAPPGQGGSVFASASVGISTTLTNTIVAGSPTNNCAAAITDGGHNLDDGTTCGFSAANGSLSNTDPAMDPAGLQNNGGPTQTIALCLGTGTPAGCTGRSPAIDAADRTVCIAPPVNDFDQRGVARTAPTDPICDIGAFEALHIVNGAPGRAPPGWRRSSWHWRQWRGAPYAGGPPNSISRLLKNSPAKPGECKRLWS